MKICVVGVGMVGTQVKNWFEDALTYDTKKQSNTWNECLEADCFFICVPTPYIKNKEYDLSYLEEAIAKIPDGKIVVIKSTVNPGTNAEWVKKIRNAFYSTKVVFFNQIYDIVKKSEPAHYETIRSVVIKDPRIGNSHSFIHHKGYRGYGGACLPKDMDSLIEFAKKKGANPELLEKVREINETLVHGKETGGTPKK